VQSKVDIGSMFASVTALTSEDTAVITWSMEFAYIAVAPVFLVSSSAATAMILGR